MLHQDRLQTINLSTVQQCLSDIQTSCTEANVKQLLHQAPFLVLLEMYDEFVTTVLPEQGPLAKLWLSYISMVNLVLQFVRATKESNWELHLQSIRQMIPWFFAYDRLHYSQYLPVDLRDMLSLPTSHPSADEQMKRGEFAVQRSAAASFSQVPVDQALERTINRDTKTSGGIIGFSLCHEAVQRWMLTAHLRAAFTRACKHLAGMTSEGGPAHQDLRPAAIKDSEDAVQRVVAQLQCSTNPFSPSGSLTNLTSGVEATGDISEDLLNAYDKGQSAAHSFYNDRLLNSSTGFHEVIPALKLKTFTDLHKVVRVGSGASEIVVRADRSLFARLAIVAQTRSLDMREVLSYELGPIPWSLATPDGGLVKTTKTSLLPLLEEGTPSAEDISPRATLILDGMAVLQACMPTVATFGLLAEQLFHHICQGLIPGGRVDFVIDQYAVQSIKGQERTRRAASGMLKVTINGPEQKLPNWKKFLAVSKNKSAFVKFLLSEWILPKYAGGFVTVDSWFVTMRTATNFLAVMGSLSHPALFQNCIAIKRRQTRDSSCMPVTQLHREHLLLSSGHRTRTWRS